MRDYRLYLKDILSAMDSIEASKNIPDEIRQQYPAVPWKEMAGMRDRLIHFYFGVDYKLVWTTIKERLPQVKSEMQCIHEDLA